MPRFAANTRGYRRANVARSTLQLFAADPFARALRTHKLGGQLAGSWAFSAGHDLRVVCEIGSDLATLLAVGSHDDVY